MSRQEISQFPSSSNDGCQRKINISADVFSTGREHSPGVPVLQAEKTSADRRQRIIFLYSQEVVILAQLAFHKHYWIFVKM